VVRDAHAAGAKVLVDGSQAAAHLPVDVQAIGADFYVFTGHKLYGPTGVGVLYGRGELLNAMPPFLGGGEMIDHVAFDKITFKDAPYRFEAGTPPIVEVIGLGAAVDYFSAFDAAAVHAHEAALLKAAEERLQAVPGVRIFSRAQNRRAIVSFGLEGVHPHDIATILDQMGIAVRAGHHCAQPLMKKLGVPATVRASFAISNTLDDVARLGEAVQKARNIFA
jgi:cysteine desulfurase/selenocysteine lyase